MSVGQSDCGAEVTAVRQGWTLGSLCGDHRVLVAATDLTTAIMDAQARQMFLRDLYGDSLPTARASCGSIRVALPRAPRKPGEPPGPAWTSERRCAQRTLRANRASRIMLTSDSIAAAKISHSAPAVP